MRDKLIELVRNASAKWYQEAVEKTTKKSSSRYIADDLLANGVIVPPCKAGDVVYQVTRDFISQFRVRFIEISICENLFLHTDLISGIIYTGEVFPESEIGKTVFLTREEAERALKGGDNNA